MRKGRQHPEWKKENYLAENAAYLKKDLGKNNISQNYFSVLRS